MSDKNKEKKFLNLLDDKCPITFVKTKIALEKLKRGELLTIHLSDIEALEGLPASLDELGYKILSRSELENGVYSLEIVHQN